MKFKKIKQKIIKQKLNVFINVDIKQTFEKKIFLSFSSFKKRKRKNVKTN